MKRTRLTAVCLCVLLWLTGVLSFAADAPPYRGVDVSRWQGRVDWSAVKAAGVDFALLRCFAYRKDANFEANYAGARAQNIPVGAYVYMYATTEAEAAAEAQGALNALGGRPLQLPLFLDVEDGGVKALGKEKVTDLMLLELQAFAAAGYRAGFYTSQSFVSAYMQADRLTGFDRWIARWTCCTTDSNPQTFTLDSQDPNSPKKPDCDIWQFSNGGDGGLYGMSSTYVDLDFCYTDYLNTSPEEPQQHTHTFTTQVTEPTCTAPGLLVQTCEGCGEVTTSEYAPALGHTEPDETGCCARCKVQLTDPGAKEEPEADPCPFCGKRHTGQFGLLVLLVHKLLALFRDFRL